MSPNTILKRVPKRVRNNISNFTSLLPTVFLDLQNRFQTHPTVLEQFKSYLGFLGFPHHHLIGSRGDAFMKLAQIAAWRLYKLG